MMYDYYYDNLSPFHFFFGPIYMIVFWVLIIWGIFALIKHLSGHHRNGHSCPLGILKERYAKGEITKEQFESMKKDLQ